MATKKHKRSSREPDDSVKTVARIKEIIAQSEELLKEHKRLSTQLEKLLRETER